ncbi:MAG: methyltransferase domain-containing protein [Oscillospiraceae bacterium]|nr:methyltransferase domain-containing protein [Oscillospiraceae bacterium]
METMKYDTNIDLDNPATSNAKLLGWISQGSEVLEIGSASGSMTRAMSELRNCKVSVIEVDPDSFQMAHQSAADGFCGDVEEKDWEEYYRGRTFDVILLSNVLEHLRNPLLLLRRSKKYLKTGGHILISIPNVAHNDIILNLLKDDFHYTETGLLDESHLHLFGEKNYYRMIRDAGLHICKEDRVYLDTGETEQNPSTDGIPEEVQQFLSLRKNGEIYQFVADLTEDGEDVPCDDGNEEDAPRLLSERQQIAKLEREIREVQDYAHQLEENNRELIANNKRLEEELRCRTESYLKELQELKNAQRDERILFESEIAKYRRELKRNNPEQD